MPSQHIADMHFAGRGERSGPGSSLPQRRIEDLASRAGRAGAQQTQPQRVTTRDERKEATRLQLIAATIDAIAEGGLSDLTLSRITERADVSRGLVNFHFDSKDQLLVETLKFLTLEYLQSWRKAVERAGRDPAAQLRAVVLNDFHPSICNRKKVAVWFGFRGESKSRPTYLEVCNRADLEFETAMASILGALIAEGGYRLDPGRVAAALGAMVEGMWLDCLMYPQTFRREEAIATVMSYLAAVLPKHFSAKDADPAIYRRGRSEEAAP
jgi:TetR/AcrR family transcriptional repressor of bet genes